MKKIYVFNLLIWLIVPCYAQFKLSGQVLNNIKADTLYLNIPYLFGRYKSNDIAIPITAQGRFETIIPINKQKFATLKYKYAKATLLLEPGKNLIIDLHSSDGSISAFTGRAAPENELLYRLQLEKLAFFTGYDHTTNPYQKLTAAEVPVKIYQPLMFERNSRLALIRASNLSAAHQILIAQEVRAQAVNDMYRYTRNFWESSGKADFSKLILTIFENEVPGMLPAPAGPRYLAFVHNYISVFEEKTAMAYENAPANQRDKTPLQYYGIGVDSARKLVDEKGKHYLDWLAAQKNLDRRVAELLLAQYIFEQTDEKLLAEAVPLLAEMKRVYPASAYLPDLKLQVAGLQAALVHNSKNTEIHIINSNEKITSIYQIVNQLKGKVVYLDVWGTWCGPCKQELIYNPQLKARFKGKDVAFVYLDMDEDSKDSKWREFIKLNNLTGWHLRKTRNDIKPFWDELMFDKIKQNAYPTYFIFDKTGKLVETDANRPSDEELVYKQLEKYL